MKIPLTEVIKKRTGIQFKNARLLETAFQHTSFVNERAAKKLEHNERLEFLGDAVLEVIVSDFLFHEYPDKPEGQLTRMRAQLVREESLAFLARKYQFNRQIRLGKGELASGGNERDSILADCFEAFLGAVYLDQGMDVARAWLDESLLKPHRTILTKINLDYKTLFQERAQQKGAVQIRYELIEQSGPAHNQVFTMGLYLNDQLVSKGSGKSKKQAEMQAAEQAYALVDEKGNIKCT
ncbi:ribonuclease III [Fundicoccus ignavus]|uniref:Ribonuclease 3 n=1 Tax=Fundicoccus ignavus TaxID=2664442 RepID=A0A6I2GJ80_9LACT|nr:ribonuclease III [Fundicoccus ignavus]MRI81348.1 ribonuclease III [Fundicoccus ignavus]MRI85339.1 ribonuclease III [Fundicoccus ignavus]MRJ48054.1 ribonuclease III [Fundicoccus ignavus]